MYETGGMRHTHLRRYQNIQKRLVVHAGAFNFGLLLRQSVGVGTTRGLQGSRERPATRSDARSKIAELIETGFQESFQSTCQTQSRIG